MTSLIIPESKFWVEKTLVICLSLTLNWNGSDFPHNEVVPTLWFHAFLYGIIPVLDHVLDVILQILISLFLIISVSAKEKYPINKWLNSGNIKVNFPVFYDPEKQPIC